MASYTVNVQLHYLHVEAGSQYKHGAWEWAKLQVETKGVDVCLEEDQCREGDSYKYDVYQPGVDWNTKHGGLGREGGREGEREYVCVCVVSLPYNVYILKLMVNGYP